IGFVPLVICFLRSLAFFFHHSSLLKVVGLYSEMVSSHCVTQEPQASLLLTVKYVIRCLIKKTLMNSSKLTPELESFYY
ncbi:hypothetical protein, partial [Bacillus cereus]|uniref:hypothetical protein n=1 Tax=Bacillus cereus TaxID=1396 RepID=UPI0034D6EB75